MLPQHPTDFWIKRWFFGVGVSAGLFLCGILSLLFRHSYAIGRRSYHYDFIEVAGLQAVFMGIVYLGLGIALFSYGYTPYSEKFARISLYGEAFGLAAVGVCGCSWLLIAG